MHEFPLAQRLAVWPLAAVARLWAASVRVSMPPEDLERFTRQGEPTVFVLWHNRLFMAAELVRAYRGGHPMYALVSASKDGAWLSAFFSACGLRAVRGSSSKRGHEAARSLVEVLRSGNDVGITPDGPRGPVYELKAGSLIVARHARAKVLLVGMDFESSWRLTSWDGFHIPLPFSRLRVRIVPAEARAEEDRDESARRIGAALRQINPDRMPAPVRKRG